MKRTMILLAIGLAVATAAYAQTTVRPPTDEEIVSAAGAARYRERAAFLAALFGSGRVPEGCTLELTDPGSDYNRSNFALYCKSPLTVCDVPNVDCPGEQ